MKEKKKTITEEDVQAALGKFLRAGGLIRHLPDQVVRRNTWVGARWDAEHPQARAREATLIKVVRGPPGSEGADGLRPVEARAESLATYTSRRKR